MTVEQHILDYVRKAKQSAQVGGDANAYDVCVGQIQSVDLRHITGEQVNEIVDTFLTKWGRMGRVVHHPRRRGWQSKLASEIRARAGTLRHLRAVDLDGEDLASHNPAIEDAYSSFCTLIGPTSAAKGLHLIAPHFFPPWDKGIGTLAWSVPRTGAILKRGLQRSSGGEYFFFIVQVQHFLDRYLSVWGQLAKEFHQTKLKMIDRYLWRNKSPSAWIDLSKEEWKAAKEVRQS